MAEIIFILEPDIGRVTVESSQASTEIAKEIRGDLGQGNVVNCARPKFEIENSDSENSKQPETVLPDETIYLYRIYHYSTVDGPGRRSVIQVAGCSIRCPGCYVPETHNQTNGKLTSIENIVAEIDKESGDHDGVTILGGEPFDQAKGLRVLVENLKAKGYHLTIYTGFVLETLIILGSEDINSILARTDLLIDGSFRRELSEGVGEYRGSRNQRLIFHPITKQKNER